MADFTYIDPSQIAPNLVDDPMAYAVASARARRPKTFAEMMDQRLKDPFAAPPKPPQPSSFPQLDPAVADGFLSQIGKATVGGLQYAAETLDKPGAAVRGLLAGRPDQLLNLIPFSDTMGITDPSKRTSGRDLLEMYAGATPNEEGFHPFKNPTDAAWDAAGLGTEIFTDPLFWLKGPATALTEAGKDAAKQGMVRAPGYLDAAGNLAGRDSATLATQAINQGKLAPTIGSRIEAGQGGLAALWNPFGKDLVFGTGPRAQQFADDWLDPFINKIKFNPIVNPIRRYMSAGASNASTELGQRVGLDVAQLFLQQADFTIAHKTEPIMTTVEAEKLVGPHVERAMDLFATDALKQGDLEALERVAAGTSSLQQELVQSPQLAALFPRAANGERLVPDDLATEIPRMVRAAQVGKAMADTMTPYIPAFEQVGIDRKVLQDSFLSYLPRHVYEDPREMQTIMTATMQPMARLATDFARVPFLKDIPLGREAINDMVRDVRISGPFRQGSLAPDQAIETILAEYLGFPIVDVAKETGWRDGMTNYDHAVQLYKWLQNLPKEYADEGKDLFNAHPAVDFFLGVRSAEKKLAQANSLLELVSRVATPTQLNLDDMPVSDLMTRGLINQGFDLSKSGLAQQTVKDKMINHVASGMAPVDIKLNKWFIPAKYAKDINQYLQAINGKDAHSALLDAADYWQMRFKGLATVPWPSFHARNLMSGMYYNLAAGKFSKDSMEDAFNVMAGNPVSLRLPSGQVLDTAEIRELAHGAGAFRSSNYVTEMLTNPDVARDAVPSTPLPLPVPTPDVTQAVPLSAQAAMAPIAPAQVSSQVVQTSGKDVLFGKPYRAFMETPRTELPVSASPFAKAVDSAERQSIGRVLRAGGSVGQNVEDFNRLSHFIEALKQGYSPEEAALSVKRWQFDYRPEAYTWAERNVMKRIIPFMSFMKNNLYLVASELSENPGGFLGQSIRAANQPNEGDGPRFTPAYISDKTHIPLGPEVDGTRKYITSLGLPFEEPFERFQLGPTFNNGVRRTAESWLGTIRPEVKGALEQLSGRNFFFGRPLKKLYSMTGYQPADQFLANSPVARFVTAYRQLVDPRKTLTDQLLNFGTGMKVSDIDMNAARRDAEDNLRTILSESPGVNSFEQFYVPESKKQFMTPEEQILMRLYYTQATRKKKEAEERRKAEANR